MAIKDPRIVRIAKVNLIGGQAKPGPVLASIGINMGEFVKQFNDKTKDQNGEVIPCIITAFKDKSFKFETKTPPVSILLKKAAKVERGAKNVKTETVATITKEQALEIVRLKMKDLNCFDEEAGLRMVYGTAKNMGIKISGFDISQKN